MHLFELFTEKATLFVYRPLIPSAEFMTWVKTYFPKYITPDELHVTIVHSKTPFINTLQPARTPLIVRDGARSLAVMGGPKGAIALKFVSAQLQQRWTKFNAEGAVWDWPSYQTHLTVTYDRDIDIKDIPPFTGVLKFGPEIFQPVREYTPTEVAA